MIRPRLSIAGLLALVVLSALGIAALSRPSDLWASVLFTISSALLVFGVLASFRCVARPRAFWQGFSLFGWAYAILAFGPWFSTELRPMLLTTRVLDEAYPRIFGQQLVIGYNTVGPHGNYGSSRHPPLSYSIEPLGWFGSPNYLEYQRIGHSLLICISGTLGGILSCWIGAHERLGDAS
jgi:hypothetical protein